MAADVCAGRQLARAALPQRRRLSNAPWKPFPRSDNRGGSPSTHDVWPVALGSPREPLYDPALVARRTRCATEPARIRQDGEHLLTCKREMQRLINRVSGSHSCTVGFTASASFWRRRSVVAMALVSCSTAAFPSQRHHRLHPFIPGARQERGTFYRYNRISATSHRQRRHTGQSSLCRVESMPRPAPCRCHVCSSARAARARKPNKDIYSA